MKLNTRNLLIISALAAVCSANAQNRLANGGFEVSRSTTPVNIASVSPTTGGLLNVDSWRLPGPANIVSNKWQSQGQACVEMPSLDIGPEQDFNIMPDRTNGLNLMIYDYNLPRLSTPYNTQLVSQVYATNGGGSSASDLFPLTVGAGPSGSRMYGSNVFPFMHSDNPTGMATISAFQYNSAGQAAAFDNFYVFNVDPVSGSATQPFGFSAFNNCHNTGNLQSMRNLNDGLRASVGTDPNYVGGWIIAGYWTGSGSPTSISIKFNQIRNDWNFGAAYQYVSIWNWTLRRWEGLETGPFYNGLYVPYSTGNGVNTSRGLTGSALTAYFHPTTKLMLFKTAFWTSVPISLSPINPASSISVDQVQIVAF